MSDERNRMMLEIGCINAMYPSSSADTISTVRKLMEIRTSVRGASLNELFQRSNDRDYILAYQSMLPHAMEFWLMFNECLGGFTDLVADIASGKRTKKREH